MTIVVFIIVLVILILIHEFGHFLAAKLAGMRVDEFGIGFPPRLWGVRRGETEYTVNAIPFGGFVKIYGEDLPSPKAPKAEQAAHERLTKSFMGGAVSFSERPRYLQVAVLASGVLMNLLFAYILLSFVLYAGIPRVLSEEEFSRAPDAALVVSGVLPDSPAARAGFEAGDRIISVVGGGQALATPSPESFTSFIGNGAEGNAVSLEVVRGEGARTLVATPETGVVPADPARVALGVAVIGIGFLPVSFFEALRDGAMLASRLTAETTEALLSFFGGIFTLSANLSDISGPIGIAGAVGDASHDGALALFYLTALISINLALINLIPVPALDGGRLLFVLIESVIRRPIPASFSRATNALGFAFLVLLMVAVTASDILKIAG